MQMPIDGNCSGMFFFYLWDPSDRCRTVPDVPGSRTKLYQTRKRRLSVCRGLERPGLHGVVPALSIVNLVNENTDNFRN